MTDKRSFRAPDDTIEVEKGKIEVLNVGGLVLAKGTAEPGWKWSDNAKSGLDADSCQLSHHGWVVSGKMKYVMDDGTDYEFEPGDVFSIGPGHDAWVEGEAPYEYIEIFPRIPLAG